MLDEKILIINRMEFLRGEEKLRLTQAVPDCATLCGLRLADIAALTGRLSRSQAWQPEDLRRQAGLDQHWLRHEGGAVLNGQPDYPADLAAIDDPPLVLFYRGQLPAPQGLLVAVVGTRQPTGRAREAAWAVGAECARLGIGLVSGLAHGIDGAAHAGCAVHAGYSVAVLAGGIDSVHPRLHRQLALRLLREGGCLVSEYGPGTEMRKYRFPARNRIISGLCRSVLVVEAPAQSGALITAQFALDQGRDVYVHAAGCQGLAGLGCAELAEHGARVIGHVGEMEFYGRSIDSRV